MYLVLCNQFSLYQFVVVSRPLFFKSFFPWISAGHRFMTFSLILGDSFSAKIGGSTGISRGRGPLCQKISFFPYKTILSSNFQKLKNQNLILLTPLRHAGLKYIISISSTFLWLKEKYRTYLSIFCLCSDDKKSRNFNFIKITISIH